MADHASYNARSTDRTNLASVAASIATLKSGTTSTDVAKLAKQLEREIATHKTMIQGLV